MSIGILIQTEENIWRHQKLNSARGGKKVSTLFIQKNSTAIYLELIGHAPNELLNHLIYIS
jgi:hypothetical protein